MASDLLLGFILGVALVGVALPMKGVLFTILEQKKQIEFLKAKNGNSKTAETFDSQEKKENG